MTERQEYHELLLTVIQSLQRQIETHESTIAELRKEGSNDVERINELQKKSERIEKKLGDIESRLSTEEKANLVSRVKTGVYVAITVTVLGVVGTVMADLWKEAVIPRITASDSSEE